MCFQIYFASQEYGLQSTVTCGGYFLMANVFAKQGKLSIVNSLYSEVKAVLISRVIRNILFHVLPEGLPIFAYIVGGKHMALPPDGTLRGQCPKRPKSWLLVAAILWYVLSHYMLKSRLDVNLCMGPYKTTHSSFLNLSNSIIPFKRSAESESDITNPSFAPPTKQQGYAIGASLKK